MTKISISPNLDKLKERAIVSRDGMISRIRARYISPGVGQDLMYVLKWTEVGRGMTAIAAGQELNPDDYPFLRQDVGVRADTLAEAVQLAYSQGSKWAIAGEIIERRKGQITKAIEAATTPAEIRQALQVDWSDLPPPD